MCPQGVMLRVFTKPLKIPYCKERMNPMPMKSTRTVVLILLSAILMWGCKSSGNLSSDSTNKPVNKSTNRPETATSSGQPNDDGTIPSGTGVEKERPAPGTGNVQGKALYNGQPAAGVEVKLCETFNQYFGGCKGETFTSRTDNEGEYLIKNVPPKIYEGLIVKVFDTDYYVFATSGIIQSAKYKIEEGQTFFAPDAHLFKNDLKLLSPKAGAKISPGNIEVKWDAYPDAAYYKFSIYADSSSGATTEYDYINKRVDGLSYVLDKQLSPGSYTCKVEAYNSNDIKLAQSASDIKFTVTGETKK
jgi:hypothetical protein